MKLALLLLPALFGLISGLISPPSLETQNKVIALVDKYAHDHLIPCFTTGFKTFSVDPENAANISGSFNWAHHNPKGWADIENEVPCSVGTMMRVASVSKAIGSGLVASLVEAGKLSWDDEVHKHVPESVFPQKTWQGEKVAITLRQLLSHLSGLRHSTDQDLLHEYDLSVHNSTQIMAMFAKDPLLAKPDTKFIYSNSGWTLIGAIVEAVEKRSYHLVLDEYLRKKIGTIHAQSDSRLELIAHRAQQYQVHIDAQGKAHTLHAPVTDNLRPFPHWPAGGVISTVQDIVTYGSEMLISYKGWDRHFLKTDTVKSMWNYRPPIADGHHTITIAGHKVANIEGRYVMGWDRRDFPVFAQDPSLSHLEVIYHIGGTGGVNTIVAIFPDKNFVFSALANRGGAGDLLQLAIEAYHIVANGK